MRTVKGRSNWLWLLLVTVVAVAQRLVLWQSYGPVGYSDTHSYRRLADAVANNWNPYDGTRVPGYPVFMALVGPDERIWLVQMALGLGTTLLLFYIGWQVSGRAWMGAAVALAHTLNLGQLFFEANILTETITTFWVVLTLAGLALWLYHPRARTAWLAAGMGLFSSLAFITRPMFIYFPFWVALFMLSGWLVRRVKVGRLSLPYPWPGSFHAFGRLVIFFVPLALIVGSWVNFIHEHYGEWALSTMTGYHLVQHTGVFFEYVPDEYAALRDTYLKYRAQRMAEYGSPTNAIWEAIPELEKVTGLGFYELARKLADISVQLIWQHPDLYLRNVLQGWWMFWYAPVYWSAEHFRWPGLASAVQALVWPQRGLLFTCNLAFIALSLFQMGVVALGWARKGKIGLKFHAPPFFWFLTGLVWIGSIVQTVLDHGDNPRFLIPLQSVVVLWVIWAVWLMWKNNHRPIKAESEIS